MKENDKSDILESEEENLIVSQFDEVVAMIKSTRNQVIIVANTAMIDLY